MTLEVITTTTDSKQWAWEIPNGGTYTVRPDDVAITVNVIDGEGGKDEGKGKRGKKAKADA